MRPAWAHTCGCKSRCELVTVSKVKRNCVRVTERGKEAWSVNREPMNKNRIEGATDRPGRPVSGDADETEPAIGMEACKGQQRRGWRGRARYRADGPDAAHEMASAFGRKFLGYALWVAKRREVKCKVAQKPLHNFKARIRQLTRRSGGRSMAQVVDNLRPYLLGWKAYFGMAQTPGVWRELDEWLRHRLRAIQLRQWKRPKTIHRELKALGASDDVAKQVAGNCHRWWRNSDGVIKRVLTIAYFERLGVPRLS